MLRHLLYISIAVFLFGCPSEVNAQGPTFVVTTTDTYSPGELRYEIENANFGDTIIIDVAGTCMLASPVNLNANVVVIGPEPIHFTIDGSNILGGNIFNTVGFDFSLYGVTLENSQSAANWFEMSTEQILLKNCYFKNNNETSIRSGGVAEGTVSIQGCSFFNNVASGNGGAIDMNGGLLKVVNCTFHENQLPGGGFGGAIYYGGIHPVEILGSTFYNNGTTPTLNGAAIRSTGGGAGISLQNNIFYNTSQNENIVVGANFASNGGNFINADSPPFGVFMNIVGSVMDPMFDNSIIDGFGLEYFPLQLGSPCIDIGNSLNLVKFDARRVWRDMQASANAEIADAGAVEFSPYTVYNSNPTGAGSFEDAVNNVVGFGYGGYKAIVFEIPGVGPFNANITSTQTISEPNLMINGFSQHESRVPGPENNGGSLITGYTPIRFNGSGASDFLDVQGSADSLLVTGLSITNFFTGIKTMSGNNVIEGCHIGVADGGYMAVPNSFGVAVPPGGFGYIKIGVGEFLWSNPRQARNVISGNTGAQIEFADCGGNIVSGNFIGPNATGIVVPTATTTGAKGVYLRSTSPSAIPGSTIGGYGMYDENTICGQSVAVHCELSNVDIAYNFMGTDYWGAAPASLPNFANQNGVIVSGVEAYDNYIEGNIIVNTDAIGINLTNASQGTYIVDNYIGLAEDGLTAIVNRGDGVLVDFDSQFNVIGGMNSVDGNYIANCDFSGIVYDNMTGFSNDSIIGNYIGLDTSLLPAANGKGIEIRDNTRGVVIGDIQPGMGNEIAYNTGTGIETVGVASINSIQISGNSMYNNGGLGIDLDSDGPSLTTGTASLSNNGQIPPVLLSLVTCGLNNYSTIEFQVDFPISMSYQIEFFHGDSDGEEGADYIGNAIVSPTTQPQTFIFNLPPPALVGGDFITATATEITNRNTSEFSDTILFNPISALATDQIGNYCSDVMGGSTHNVDLITDFDALVNSGDGFPVSWYSDPACTAPLATPSNYPGFNTQIVYAVVDDGICTDTAQVTVVVNSSPDPSTANPATTDATCFGLNDGTATYTLPPGPPESFDWGDGNGAVNSNSVSGLLVGTYTLIYTDANGCVGTDTYVINEPTQVTVTASNISPLCNGSCDGSLISSAAGGFPTYTYSWDGGPTPGNQNQAGVCAGTYTVTAIDANGCSAVMSTTVNDPTLVSATIFSWTDVLCFGDINGDATVIGGGGDGGPYTFQWDAAAANQTTATATGLPAGAYGVDVYDGNGCIGSNIATISQPASPVNVSIVKDNDISCFGLTDGQATVIPSGGTPGYTYVWAPVPPTGQGTITASNLPVGNFSCVVADANGCTVNSSTITIIEPTALSASMSNTDASCNGLCDGVATVTPIGGTSPYTYVWSSGGTAITETGLCAGTYNVTITDANGCTFNIGATISEPSLLTVSVWPSANPVCGGDAVTLSGTSLGGTSPYTESWDNGVTNGLSFNAPLISTLYTFTSVDLNGCITTDVINLTVDPLPVSTPGPNVSVCSNNPDVNLSGAVANAVGGNWTGGGGVFSPSSSTLNAVYTPSGAEISGGSTLIQLTTFGSGACPDATNSLTVTFTPSPIVNAGGAISVCANNANAVLSGTVTNAIGGLWSSSGTGTFSPSNTALNATYIPSGADISSGTVSITLTSTGNGNCLAVSDIMTISINPAPTVNAGPDTTICGSGATVNLNASISVATGVTWSGGSGVFSNPNILNPVYIPSAGELLGGSVILTATTTGNGLCLPEVSSMTVTITPPPTTSAIFGNPIVCEGDLGVSYNVTNTVGSSYLWTAPFGASITSGQGTNTVAVDFSNTGGSISVTETNSSGCIGNPISLAITNNPLPTVTGSTNTTICEGFFTTLSGAGALTYAWDNGVTDGISFQPPVGVTIYTVTGTDANGCMNTSTTTVTVDASPSISNTFTDATCSGANDGTIEITTTGGASPYQYSNDGGSTYVGGGDPFTYSGLIPTTYSIYVMDANGCVSNNISQNIMEPAPLSIDSIQSFDESCSGNDGSITVYGAAGGTPNYDYSADGGTGFQAANVFAGLTAGSYPMILQDQNGCTLNLGTVTIGSTPPVAISTVSFTDVTCNGSSDGTITANSATGGSGTYSYQWYNTSTGALTGETALTTSVLSAGDYYIEATDGTCIQNSDTVTVSEPAPIILNVTPSNPTCFGDTDGSILIEVVSGGTAPFTFSDDNGGVFNVGSSPYTFGETAGSYDVIVQDNNGCQTVPQNVNIVDPSQLILTLTVTNESCFGAADGVIEQSGSGGTGTPYNLNINGAGFFVMGPSSQTSGLSDGYTQTAIIMDANGCTDTATASVVGPPQITFNTTLTPDTCSQGVGNITLTNVAGGTGGPYGYSVDNGGTIVNTTVINVVAGTYDLVVGDMNGCLAVAPGLVVTDVAGTLTLAGTYPGDTICPGESTSIQAFGGTSYNWLTPGVDSPLSDSTEVSPDSTTQYIVEITSGGCMKTDSTLVIVDGTGCAVGEISNNVFTPDGDNINDTFILDIQYLLSNDNTVSIYNRWGDLINDYINYDNNDVAWDGNNRDGSPVPAGTYFFVVEIPSINYSNSGWIQVVR